MFKFSTELNMKSAGSREVWLLRMRLNNNHNLKDQNLIST